MEDNEEFAGEISHQGPLTTSGEPRATKRGRRKSFGDGELWGARSEFLEMLEGYWGEIGWELRRAKNLEQLRSAFKPVSGINNRLQFLARPSTSIATPVGAQVTRRKLGSMNEGIRFRYERERHLRDKLDNASRALAQVRGKPQESEIKHLWRQRDEELKAFVLESERIQREERQLQEHLMDQLAYIAQSQLLSFIRSGRYSLNPLHFANAMAGLPLMGWRQSMKRCQTLEKPLGPGSRFQTFRLVERVSKRSPKGSLLSALEAELRTQSKANFAAQEMKKNWYYLRHAVEEVLKENVHPGAIPYRIVAEYVRRMSNRSAVDFVLEEEQQLL